ncbi:HalOD1 output domain-containing protein [Natrialbaceae archaeon A-gly3]
MADAYDDTDTPDLETRSTDVHSVTYDVDTDDSLVGVVVDAIATVADCDPLEVEPLYDTIDPEALETLFVPGPMGPRSGTVTFSIEEWSVTITDGRYVSVRPAKR